nr:DBF4-type zinc finger-containing protein 2 homolog [Aegilops tauschii subsp. strangulata]
MPFLCHAPCVAGALRLPCRVAAPPSSALAPRALLCCSASCCPQLLRPRRRSGAGAPASPPAAPPSPSCTHLRPWASCPHRCAAALTRARPVPGRQDDYTACSPGPHPPARRRPRAAPSGSASLLALAGFCRAWRPPQAWLRLRPSCAPASATQPAGLARADFCHPACWPPTPRRLRLAAPAGSDSRRAGCRPAAPAAAPPRQSTRADHRLRIRLRRLPPHRADSARVRLLAAAAGPGRIPAAAGSAPSCHRLRRPAAPRPRACVGPPVAACPARLLYSRAPPAGFPSRLVPRMARPAPALADSPATRPARLPADYVLPRRLPPLGNCGRLLVLEGAGCPKEKRNAPRSGDELTLEAFLFEGFLWHDEIFIAKANIFFKDR